MAAKPRTRDRPLLVQYELRSVEKAHDRTEEQLQQYVKLLRRAAELVEERLRRRAA